MYSFSDRIRAVKFYINCGFNAAYTVRKFGYLDATSLKHWYKEYLETDTLHEQKVKYSKYTDLEKRVAVDYYFEHHQNALKTVQELGYPSRPLLMNWVKELNQNHAEERCKVFKSHVRCSQEEQIKAVMEHLQIHCLQTLCWIVLLSN